MTMSVSSSSGPGSPWEWPEVAGQVDLSISGILEASAGTGKTYTIEHLVLRILAQKDPPDLEEILVLTFTEKATGELKEKIRARLQERSGRRDLPPETQRAWKQAWLNFDRASIHTIHGFCRKVLENFAFENASLFETAIVKGPEFQELHHKVLREEMRSGWLRHYGDTLDSFQRFAAAIGLENGEDWVAKYLRIAMAFDPSRGDRIHPAPFRPGKNTDLPTALEMQSGLIHSLRTAVDRYLHQRGLIGFDGMIRQVHSALEANPELAKILRKRYKICIVDEFQDTDPLQWEIFRKLYLEEPDSGTLLLIGDPKQAIYGFRGADVQTYMQARSALRDRAMGGGKQKAQGMRLKTNYRSSAQMIRAHNLLFSRPCWFGAGTEEDGNALWNLAESGSDIRYSPVNWGANARQECRNTDGNAAPIVIGDFRNHPTMAKAREGAMAWIVGEIASLLNKPDQLGIFIPETKSFRPLNAGDICILVRNKREKIRMETLLEEAGIPFAAYKKSGLYQSAEALHLSCILEALESPGDSSKFCKALTSRFFSIPINELASGRNVAPNHPIFRRLEAWRLLAGKKRWSRLFHALFYDTGLLYRESLEKDGGRRIANFLHISQNLSLEAFAENLDLKGLVDTLNNFRLKTVLAEAEEDLHRPVGETRQVAVMTMHISKGLEFPVVFLAGGFGKNPKPQYIQYKHMPSEKTEPGASGSVQATEARVATVFCLDMEDAQARSEFAQQESDENRRLLYVAFTRARFKLYIPMLAAKYPRVESGPLGDFVASALLEASRTAPELFRIIPIHPLNPVQPLPPPLLPSITAATAFELQPKQKKPTGEFPIIDVFPGSTGHFLERRVVLESYSHLAYSQTVSFTTPSTDSRFAKEEAPPHTSDTLAEMPEPLVAALPDNAPAYAPPPESMRLRGGAEVGNMFHEILEAVDFEWFKTSTSAAQLAGHKPLQEVLDSQLRRFNIPAGAADGITGILWHTLRTSLPDPAGGPSFRLCDLENKCPEMEFLFPFKRGERTRCEAVPATEARDGFIWGFIDLVFRHRERYYILDWKSNILADYGRESLHKSMLESHYDLQYTLYATAVVKWLHSILPSFDYDKNFGGIYYLYIRGMQENSHKGIYGLRPTRRQIEVDFPGRLDEALGAKGPGRQS